MTSHIDTQEIERNAVFTGIAFDQDQKEIFPGADGGNYIEMKKSDLIAAGADEEKLEEVKDGKYDDIYLESTEEKITMIAPYYGENDEDEIDKFDDESLAAFIALADKLFSK